MNGRTLVIAATLALALFQAASVQDARGTAHASPVMPGDDAGKVREWIAALGSSDPKERASAACSLGELGERADAAIPALVRLLGDETAVSDFACGEQGSNEGNGGTDLTVGKVAAVSLARINGPAVDALVTAIGDANWVTRRNAAH